MPTFVWADPPNPTLTTISVSLCIFTLAVNQKWSTFFPLVFQRDTNNSAGACGLKTQVLTEKERGMCERRGAREEAFLHFINT